MDDECTQLWIERIIPSFIWGGNILPHLGDEWVRGVVQQAALQGSSELLMLMIALFGFNEPLPIFPMVPENLRSFMAYPTGSRLVQSGEKEWVHQKVPHVVMSRLRLFAMSDMAEAFMLLCRAAGVEWYDVFPSEIQMCGSMYAWYQPGSLIYTILLGGGVSVLSAVLTTYQPLVFSLVNGYVKPRYLVAYSSMLGNPLQVGVVVKAWQLTYFEILGWFLLGVMSCKNPESMFNWIRGRVRLSDKPVRISIQIPRLDQPIRALMKPFGDTLGPCVKKEYQLHLIPTGRFVQTADEIVYTPAGRCVEDQKVFVDPQTGNLVLFDGGISRAHDLGVDLNAVGPVHAFACGNRYRINTGSMRFDIIDGLLASIQYGRVGAEGNFHPLYAITTKHGLEGPVFRWFVGGAVAIVVECVYSD